MANMTFYCERCGLRAEVTAQDTVDALTWQHRDHGNGRQGVWVVPEGDTLRDATRIG